MATVAKVIITLDTGEELTMSGDIIQNFEMRMMNAGEATADFLLHFESLTYSISWDEKFIKAMETVNKIGRQN